MAKNSSYSSTDPDDEAHLPVSGEFDARNIPGDSTDLLVSDDADD